MNLQRRKFIATGAAAMAATFVSQSIAEESPSSAAPTTAPGERKRPPPQELAQVLRFVQAGHRDLPKVQEMVARDPKFVLAAWDWGEGDWETALGGASHVGRRDIARYLLSQGARIDAFCAAMLGEREVMLALLKTEPTIATTKGPHGYTLLYHVAISGDVEVAEAMKPTVGAEREGLQPSLECRGA